MGKVILDSDSVSKVSKGMDTLSSNVETILSNVRSYDVSSSDFDFSSAKDAIVNNLKGLETKVKNTNTLLDTVVKVHTELQESVEDKNEGIEEDEEAKGKIDNTKNEKTMKETVSITKIVQPIT